MRPPCLIEFETPVLKEGGGSRSRRSFCCCCCCFGIPFLYLLYVKCVAKYCPLHEEKNGLKIKIYIRAKTSNLFRFEFFLIILPLDTFLTEKNHQKHFLETKIASSCMQIGWLEWTKKKRIKDRNWMRKNGNIRKKEKKTLQSFKNQIYFLIGWLTWTEWVLLLRPRRRRRRRSLR